MPKRIKKLRDEIPTTDEERQILAQAGLSGCRYVVIEGEPGFRRSAGEFADISLAKMQITAPTATIFGRTQKLHKWIQVYDRRLENDEYPMPKSRFYDPNTGYTLPGVAKVCGVSVGTAHKWVRGIVINGVSVRLECDVIGTRCKVTDEQIVKFKAECRAAKLGEHGLPATITPAEFDAIGQRAREEALAACRS